MYVRTPLALVVVYTLASDLRERRLVLAAMNCLTPGATLMPAAKGTTTNPASACTALALACMYSELLNACSARNIRICGVFTEGESLP
jgi:hypothetical protein